MLKMSTIFKLFPTPLQSIVDLVARWEDWRLVKLLVLRSI